MGTCPSMPKESGFLGGDSRHQVCLRGAAHGTEQQGRWSGAWSKAWSSTQWWPPCMGLMVWSAFGNQQCHGVLVYSKRRGSCKPVVITILLSLQLHDRHICP